jgi:serine phosphatase RsbU (regulator of sigma subunit)
MALCFNSLGSLFSDQKNYEKAAEYAKQSLKLAEEIGSPDDERNAYGSLSECYYKTGKYREAYDNMRKYYEKSDSLRNQSKVKEITQLEMQYEFDKKQKETEFETQKKEIAQREEMKSQKLIRNFFFIAFALTLVLLFFIYKEYRAKRRANILLEKQKAEIEEKNREITSSIRYAKRIQEATLPVERVFRQFLHDSFVFYKPKDIVSGDFYWVDNVNGQILFAVADCTGHGVPGAFISIIGYNGLNRAVHEFHLSSPDAILNKLNEIVNDTLRQTFEESIIRDGMDIAVCRFIPGKMLLEYSGANNPLYHIRNGNISIIRSDRQPIGHFMDYSHKPFTLKEINVQRGDMVYLFSDGYPDQLGGPDGKKLKYQNFQKLLLSVSELTPEQQHSSLENYFMNWSEHYPQLDDVCLVGVRF